MSCTHTLVWLTPSVVSVVLLSLVPESGVRPGYPIQQHGGPGLQGTRRLVQTCTENLDDIAYCRLDRDMNNYEDIIEVSNKKDTRRESKWWEEDKVMFCHHSY